MQEIRNEQSSLRKSRGKVFDRQASLTNSISKKTADLKAQQTKLTYKTIEEIDEVIGKTQNRIDSGSLKIVDERRLTNELAGLRRTRKLVDQTNKLQEAIDRDMSELAEVDDQLADTNAQALGEELEQVQKDLDALKASQEDGLKNRNELFAERSRVLKALDQEWEIKRELQDEHRRVNNEYYQWQQGERKRRAIEEKQRRLQEQREKRLAMAQEQREEAEIPAFENEINGCDSLIIYLNGLLPSSSSSFGGGRSEDSSRPSSSASGVRRDVKNEHVPPGMVAVKRVDIQESYFAGTGSSGKSRKRKDKMVDVLKHPLSVAEHFLELKVDIPISTGNVPGTIEKLEAKKQYYLKNQKVATEEKKRAAEEKISKLMAEMDMDEKMATAESSTVAAT